MKERPILMSAPMVNALLEGLKTQTRRICKGQRELSNIHDFQLDRCPYGQPGDRLYVRETTSMRYLENFLTGEPTNSKCGEYAADHKPILDSSGFDYAWWYSKETCPSIFMPRWASRILLEIANVRVERLQDISEEDAKAEGVRLLRDGGGTFAGREGPGKLVTPWMTAIEAYRDLWQTINGQGSWDLNPWVWVVEFKRVNHEE
jgi:hypothetical protein